MNRKLSANTSLKQDRVLFIIIQYGSWGKGTWCISHKLSDEGLTGTNFWTVKTVKIANKNINVEQCISCYEHIFLINLQLAFFAGISWTPSWINN